MRLPSKNHPILASLLSAVVSIIPLLATAIFESSAYPSGGVGEGQMDDAPIRAAGLPLFYVPFLFLAAVPVSYLVGRAIVALGLHQLRQFLFGALVFASLVGITIGVLIRLPSRFGWSDVAFSIAITSGLMMVCVLPAAACWWCFAVRTQTFDGVAVSRRVVQTPASRV